MITSKPKILTSFILFSVITTFFISACNESGPTSSSTPTHSAIPETPEITKSLVIELTDQSTHESPSALINNFSNNQLELPPDMLMVMTDIGHDMFLQDISSGDIMPFSDEIIMGEFIKWQNEGCEFFIQRGNGDIQLIDLDGNIIITFFTYQDLIINGYDPWGNVVHLSPDNNRIWYWEGSGESIGEATWHPRMELQDIKVISLDVLGSLPIQISLNSGAWVADWSPDSQLIAYSDYDDQQVHQVYIYSLVDHTWKQVTSFNRPSAWDQHHAGVYEVAWSPDGGIIAINHYVNEMAQLSIYDLQNDVSPPKYQLSGARILWWIDNEKIVVRRTSDEGGYKDIQIINMINGTIDGQILDQDFLNMYGIHAFISPDLLGFFSYLNRAEFYVYDSKTGIMYYHPKIGSILDLIQWVTTPSGFPGLSECME